MANMVKAMSTQRLDKLLDTATALIKKAWADDDFKRRLILNENKYFEEAGCTIPEGLKITVHECYEKLLVAQYGDGQVLYIPFPPPPPEDDPVNLEAVAAGYEDDHLKYIMWGTDRPDFTSDNVAAFFNWKPECS